APAPTQNSFTLTPFTIFFPPPNCHSSSNGGENACGYGDLTHCRTLPGYRHSPGCWLTRRTTPTASENRLLFLSLQVSSVGLLSPETAPLALPPSPEARLNLLNPLASPSPSTFRLHSTCSPAIEWFPVARRLFSVID